ncbi:MAG: ribonuclease HII [Candidatus Pacebacteria bacterium]|nr:ribonuclease HII [Candidatus Paceibacterota bacterium]
MIQEEKKLWKRGFKHVAGIDEAGRGPLAGPVFASAVLIMEKDFLKARKIKSVRDSKKLKESKREEVFSDLIKSKEIKWGVGKVSEKMIDKINILQATKLAMVKAIKDLEKRNKLKVDFIILDGKMKLDLDIQQKSIIKADDKVFSVSAASIIAKVSRDALMKKHDKKYPEYDFEKHKGYGTKEHLEKIRKYGICPIHRKTFAPIKGIE